MANLLNKDPFTYEEERRSFMQDLKRFHQNRGTPFDRISQIGGREVDLYRLYRRVIELGGWQKVNNEEKWEDIQGEFRLPRSCTNGAQALKQIYVRYLNIYEKVHFFGQDPSRTQDDEEDLPARKKLCTPLYGVPLSYNYHHHQPTESVRQTYGLSLNLVKISDYDKLEKALLSGLPNEVDFVVNVCTLLSNEGRHVLRLEKSQHILELLLAHIGIFDDDDCSCLEDLYKSGWMQYSKRDFLRFWYESVREEAIRDLITIHRVKYARDRLAGEDVLNLGRDLGLHDAEGQRVTQLAVLLRNLSFEEANQRALASNKQVFKFLMLCVHSTYGTLQQLAFDTLGNLAAQMVLKPVEMSDTKLILELITGRLCSNDKFSVVRALEILGKLCQLEENEVILSDNLEYKTYEDMCHLLTIHDIQLIVHTLEALYQLSELGESTTTRIAAVKFAVDLLISLITIEAQSYGPNSLIGIKVVEFVPPSQPHAADNADVRPTASMVMQPPGTPLSKAALSQSAPLRPQQQVPDTDGGRPNGCSDLESTTCNWLQATYEIKRGTKLTHVDLFSDYLQFCRKFVLPNILTSGEFLHLVKVVFPQAELTSIDKANGDKDICFVGLTKRSLPKPFAITHSVPKSRSVTVNSLRGSQTTPNTSQIDLTQTPTLRQRLMEPPRIPFHQQLLHTGAGSTLVGVAPVVRPSQPTPQGSKSSHGMPASARSSSAGKAKNQQNQAVALGGTSNMVSDSPHLPGASPPQSGNPSNPSGPKPKSVLQQQLQTPATLQPSSVPVALQGEQPLAQGCSMAVGSGQQFPSIQQALQMEGIPLPKTGLNINDLPPELIQRSSDTNLIKSLLARKVSQNMVGRQSHPFPSQNQASSNQTIVTEQRGPSPQQTPDTHLQQPVGTYGLPQVAIPGGEFGQHNNHSVDSISPVPQPESPQPQTLHQVPFGSQCPTSTLSSKSSQPQKAPPSNIKTSKSKKGNSSPRPASPKASSKSSRSSSGSRPSSPRAASPRSQAYELEVCGEVERAKDIVNAGAETLIERVENRGLQQWQNSQKTLTKPSSVSTPTHLEKDSLAGEHSTAIPVPSSTEENVSKTDTPSSACSSSASLNPFIFSASSDPSEETRISSKDHKEICYSKAEYVANNHSATEEQMLSESEHHDSDCECNPNESQNSVESSLAQTLPGNMCTNTSIDNITVRSETEKDKCSVSGGDCVNDNIIPPGTIMNGDLVSPDNPDSDLPPSPIKVDSKSDSCLVNGIGSEKVNPVDDIVKKTLTKEQITKCVEKAGKVNGIVHCFGNGDHARADEIMEVDQGVVNCSNSNEEQRVPLFGEQVRSKKEDTSAKTQGFNGENFDSMQSPKVDNVDCSVKGNGIVFSSSLLQKDNSIASSPSLIEDQKTSSNETSKILCGKRTIEKLEVSTEKPPDKKICDMRQILTPETSRDSELSSDSFASSTAESVSEKHSITISNVLLNTSTNSSKDKTNRSQSKSDKPKARKRSRSNASNASTGSMESRNSVILTPTVPEYMCEWNGCKKCFENSRAVFYHVNRHHITGDTDGICRWEGCEQLQRRRWSLVAHCQDHHCSEHALRAAHQRRFQAAQQGNSTSSTTTTSTLVYPPDAAMQAIKRFSVRPPFTEFMEPREGPVTKHIRLTAALILRNLARYSALGRSLIKKREGHLSYQTMSAVESSTALANCLWEILHDH